MINTSDRQITVCISADGAMLYFWSDAPSRRLTDVPIIPIVDFNGDGQVDGKELLAMIAEFGGNDALCDIGPTPWGDGVVDFEDLKVLAEHIGEEIEDPTLVAHWAFDETEGSVAVDSAGDYDGAVVGGATWQPEGGVIGGAIQCNGVNGCVVTDTIPDLGTGPFSVIAWVKGAEPGEIILCHDGDTDWLMANPIDGTLMTKLTGPSQPMAQGFSDVVITDGKWHRIALVWDGMDRILCADGKEVARDSQPDITVCEGSVHDRRQQRARHSLVRPDRRRADLQPHRAAVTREERTTRTMQRGRWEMERRLFALRLAMTPGLAAEGA